MARVRAQTPVWVKVALVAVVVLPSAWWLVERHDRLGNEARLGAIASAIAGREVRVSCPGVAGRILSWDTVAGSVQFDAAGRPGDVTKLRAPACAELDAVAEGRRDERLACGRACADELVDLAAAVNTLAHESWHLHGVMDEAETECRAMGSLAWTAEHLGVPPADAALLVELYRDRVYPYLGEAYRGGSCASSA